MSSCGPPASRFSRYSERLFNWYCQLVFTRPLSLIFATFFVCTVLSAWGIYYHYDVINFDPEKGFETRGTPLSESKILLDRLITITATPELLYEKSIKISKREAKALTTTSEVPKLLENSSEDFFDPPSEYANRTYEPISVNYEEYGVNSEPNADDLNSDPCAQYNAVHDMHLAYVYDAMPKIIVETEDLYTLKTFRALCEVDEIFNQVYKNAEVKPTLNTNGKHSFNLPYVATCLNFSTPNKCSSLNQADIDSLKKIIGKCSKEDNESDICQHNIVQMASNLLLPRDKSSPLVTVLFPLRKWDQPQDFYEQLQKELTNHFSKHNMKLRGVDFDMKQRNFFDGLYHDSLLSVISAALVLITFFLYSRSYVFILVIFLLIFFSMTLAFFAYTVILRIDFFPFLNLLVIVLMTSVGADDAFLLLSYYKRERKHLSSPWKPGDIYLPAGPLHIRCLQNSIRHSLMSMFITSATTAVAFLSNLSSDIVVLRCFGIYACLTVMFNYMLIVFILPATIMITQSDREPLPLASPLAIIADLGVQIISSIRWIIVLFGTIATCIAVYVTFYKPGLHLPEHNPTRLMVGSNPSEFYDDNAYRFNYEWKRTYYIPKYFLIDKMHTPGSAILSVKHQEVVKAKHLELTNTDITNIKKAVNLVLKMSGATPGYIWIDKFTNSSCSSAQNIEDKCFTDYLKERLPAIFPPAELNKDTNDGPIFDKNLQLIGYYLTVPSKFKYSPEATGVSKAFKEIESDCNIMKRILGEKLPLRCLSAGRMINYNDIIERLRPSTLYSVAISLVVSLVVVILCTQSFALSVVTVAVICGIVLWTTCVLVLLGWQLSVVESTIIVLTIGLSFDYSLHIAASVRDSSDVFMKDTIRSSFNSAGIACTLAACSSIVCGLPLLFSDTAAFFQVGNMLVVLGFTSLTGAVIMLPACLFCLYSEKKTAILKF